MFRKNAAADNSKDSGDTVRLPSLFGVKPGKYLTVLYAAVLMIVLFFVLVFPGIVKRGSYVTFTSEPSGAAVRVDDVFFDATPCVVFVPEGRRRFDIALPGFNGFSAEKDVGTRLFASVIFPRRQSVHAGLSEKSPLYALTLACREAAAWSFTGESAAMYQIPLSLSEGAYRSAPASGGGADELLRAAARFTSSRAFLKDLLRAKFLADNAGRSPTPFAALQTVKNILAFIDGNPAFTIELADLLGETAKPLLESPWYRKNVLDKVFPPRIEGQMMAQNLYQARFGGNLAVNGVNFVEVEDGIFKAAADFSHETPVRRYYIAANEVSDGEWAEFLAENPEWRAENTATLAEENLVNAQYLVKTPDRSYPSPTVSGVSWFAAEAYCRWLGSKLPPSMSAGGWTVRLPSEIEWEYAAKGVAGGFDGGRLTKMFLKQAGQDGSSGAGLWEWCADSFAPLHFLSAGSESVAAVGSPKRSVRGGCWVNPAGMVSPETRAGLAPYSCSPFVSFRPVIARTEAAP
jgi:formylglycine-generating enzyme required for sulfatase activity